ncbi:asparagine synthase (glutamine-hydrolyzing) [Acetobacter pasteurianus]|uniref:asparagine synthase (glutamine-hydrolyzing) n=1 Tax=Acetobacter pasteurianus TaxID=438 RepID=A0A1A0DQF3_ACEPA|nr:asparagine synthase (glutamine-hydrolyzing) [Acetobacter pasteurianus]OAZ76902.1 Asparagine synthase (glutamine-hydrolyzing) [Acetobacter pasteurianus]RCL09387.1 asparagine synthase (glutamine-hydrolyzing) [Acetobacter pasteurianus]GAB30782.1 asparagine synthetase [Acetobacter pasteurianus subsp. pasteurianus LMG 1262 = NBRC 106471]GCD50036.1 asparagine synthetase [Acetobacter pasteurianus subsp. pasteurianus LMG 1262 = NBRC 106471]
MCGIGGLIYTPGTQPCSESVLERMAQALGHRGPNGVHIARLGRADMVHTRLAIIDLEGGDQPLTSGDGTLVANGEIYNDPQIRRQIGPEHFQTGSDCESPLLLWERNGCTYTRGLRGMYAIGLYDKAQQELLLSRDPFGIKPLYFTEFSGGIAFASEPAPLIASGLAPRAIAPAVRDELLQLQFTTGWETIFPGIQRIMPGETLRINQGRILDRQRQSPIPSHAPFFTSEAEALNYLDAALMDSVHAHERSDVPFGLFLSGGIDSACLLTAMSRLPRTTPLRTWTAIFDAPGAADEAEAANALAQHARAKHETLRITADMVWQHLPAIVACMDDPVADYAIIPTWFLAQKAAQDVTVILSGEGGDELFCGYGRYRSASRPWWKGKRRMWRRGIFDNMNILRQHPAHWRDGIAAAEMAAADAATPLSRLQAVDIAEWLPNDLLIKLDRCLMAHGLEGRTPLLDPVVAQTAWRLPDSMRLRDGKGKWLLRKWLQQHNSAARPFAPKQGFTVPIGTWIRQQGAHLGDLVARQECIAEIARPDRVKALFRAADNRRTGAAAWALLFYALWHRTHIRNLPTEGDVFSALSQ